MWLGRRRSARFVLPWAFGIVLLAGARSTRSPVRLAAQLEPGMVLVYVSDGSPQPPWTIDSLQLAAPLLKDADCAVIHLRRDPGRVQSEESRLCVARDTLYRWEARGGKWMVARPVGADMVWTVARANGDVVRYETTSLAQDIISGRTIPVVLTTVTTIDSVGMPKRRLRERYAVTLATATGGIFEVPDANTPGSWLAGSKFELREIRPDQ